MGSSIMTGALASSEPCADNKAQQKMSIAVKSGPEKNLGAQPTIDEATGNTRQCIAVGMDDDFSSRCRMTKLPAALERWKRSAQHRAVKVNLLELAAPNVKKRSH
jgi:hypothetical protein